MLTRIRKSKTFKLIAVFTAFNMLVEMVSPSLALALTGGTGSPEFASFEPVATTDMVNDFTGDFTYNLPVLNVPGPDGGGYSMSLSYHSGVSSEQEASWVGFGWTLNPGAINRQKRGLPDDFKDVSVTKYNKTKPNWTQLSSFNFNMEYQSQDDEKEKEGGDSEDNKTSEKQLLGDRSQETGVTDISGPLAGSGAGGDAVSVSLSKSIRYNNYSGFAITNGFGIGAKGLASLNMNRTGGENTFGFSVNPIGFFQKYYESETKEMKKEYKSKLVEEGFANKGINNFLARTKYANRDNASAKMGLFRSSYSAWSYNAPAMPYTVAHNLGKAYNISLSLQVNPTIPVGFQIGMRGSLNYQVNYPEVDHKAYGYMYNPNRDTHPDKPPLYDDASASDYILSDFTVENATTFNKHDRNLGIPFNTADVFSATGNGVTGGFRFYHDQLGHYYPTMVKNRQGINQLGIEGGIGATIQVGFDVGIGEQRTLTHDWRKLDDGQTVSDYEFEDLSSAPLPNMRFTGDMGGELDYSGDDQPLTAYIGGGFLARKLDLSPFGSSGEKLDVDTDKEGETSRIEYTTGADNTVSSISVTNKDGNKSVYGLPVYTNKEVQYTIGVGLDEDYQDGDAVHTDYIKNHELYYTTPKMNKTVIGQKHDQPYASTFLLTAKTTSDYYDLGNAGLTEDDYGGWTKFDYKKVHPDYRYRVPYTGLTYNRGKLYDGRDQTGSMSSGTKEVYYLKYVETKTHVAFFVTNESQASDYTGDFPGASNLDLDGSTTKGGDKRYDGLGANDTFTNGKDDAAAGGVGSEGDDHLQRLERIVLVAKDDMENPIRTTFFEYDYSLCQNIPNTDASSASKRGKLTLKKVWTESGGVQKSKIAPYRFDYNYFTDYPSEIDAVYPNLESTYEDYTKSSYGSPTCDQNPQYKPGQLDPWGFYRPNGEERHAKMQPWVSQTEDESTFDPAAWQLKRIVLPSGGEIHVQYEQKDYRYVQDKKAMAMVSLKDGLYHQDKYKSGDTRFYINTDDLDPGIDVSAYRDELEKYFVTLHNKLYFKILYTMEGEYNPNLSKFNHRYTYVTGYTSVNDVVQDGSDIYLKLGAVKLKSNGDIKPKKDKTLPRWVCYQKLLTAADRTLGWNARDVHSDDEDILDRAYNSTGSMASKSDIREIGRQYTAKNTFNFFGNWVGGKIKNRSKDEACRKLNFDLSYFKLPMPGGQAKKGGGIRVRRLLSYDPGIAGESGDAMVFGSEYIYQSEDGGSSGVATNEPHSIREENPLVTVMERKKQKLWHKMLNGRDSKQMEGPLGESLLPGASVVHERVIVKNIHSGKTTTGFAVNQYHTVKDYPMETDFTDISKKGSQPTYKKFNLNLPLGMLNFSMNKAWVAQGYVFKLNDMHGKPESKATYAGNYHEDFYENSYTSMTAYNYSEPGEEISSLVYDPGAKKFEIGTMSPGTEEDLTLFRSRTEDHTNDFSVELDLNITLTCAISLGFGLSYTYQENELSQHVTSKVLRQKSYLLSTTTTTDGVTQTTDNIAFNKRTGDPVLTRTYDGYDSENEFLYSEGDGGPHNGYFYSLKIPAHWIYGEMGKMSDNASNSNQLTASVGNVVTYGENALADAVGNGDPDYDVTNTSQPFANVVNASATVYKKDWFSGMHVQDGNYYPIRTYVYRNEVDHANAVNGKIYEGGVIPGQFNFFNWDPTGTSGYASSEVDGLNSTDKDWYSESMITQYSPHGYAVEEQDVLGITSAAKYGYENTLPVMVAQNAGYDEIVFRDYEYNTSPIASNVTSDYAHSGNTSFDYTSDPNHKFAKQYNVASDMITDRGLTVKLWLKSSLSNNPSHPDFGLKNPNPQLKALIGGVPFNMKKIAQTGDWSLYTAEISNFNGLSAGNHDVKLSYNTLPGEQVLIDDFRMQPLNAIVNCTVYNKDKKVTAQFDDQHFGVYYEYDKQGLLVRKSIETERGRKTLQEQHQNTPKEPRWY